MTSYVTPKKNVAFKTYIGLMDQADTQLLKANPTIAAGDFKVSIDSGAFANLTTLPSAAPASGRSIMIDLSAAEMNGDNIVLQCVDAAGAEWCDLLLNIQTTARQIDDLAFPSVSGRSFVVDGVAGLIDVNVVKLGPTGAGTAQTARDLGLGANYAMQTEGTMQAGSTSTTAVLAAATTFANDILNDSVVAIFGGTGAGQSRMIDDWVSGTDTATVSPAWTTTPDNTSVYKVFSTAPVSTTNVPTVQLSAASLTATAAAIWNALTSGITTASSIGKRLLDFVTTLVYAAGTGMDAAATRAALGLASANLDTQLGAGGVIGLKTAFLPSATAGAAGGLFIAGSNAATTVNFTGNITGNLSGSAGSVTGAVGSVTGSVGSVTGAVGSVTGGALEATLTSMKGTTFATGTDSLEAIRDRGDSAWVTGSFSGLDAAATRAAVGLAAANLDTQMSGINVKTVNLPANPAAVGSEMILSSAGLAAVLTTLQASSDWKKFLANVQGGIVFTPPVGYPGTGTLVLKQNQDGTGATLLTETLTYDANEVLITRVTV